MSDWWSRRLGGDAPAPQQRPSTPPTQQPNWVPQPPPPPAPNWAGAGGAGATQAPGGTQGYIPVEEQALDEQEVFAALAGLIPVETRGDKAAKDVAAGNVEGQCPECGSNNYFSRMYAENGTRLRNPPAPQCHDCGFPLVQSGSQGGALAGAKKTGNVTQARMPAKGDPAAHGY